MCMRVFVVEYASSNLISAVHCHVELVHVATPLQEL